MALEREIWGERDSYEKLRMKQISMQDSQVEVDAADGANYGDIISEGDYDARSNLLVI